MISRAQVWLLCLVLTGIIFAFDTQLPLVVAPAAPYVLVVWFAVWLSRNPRDSLIFASLCTILTVAGALYSQEMQPAIYIVINRGLSLAAVWITAVVGGMFRRSQDALSELNRDLEQRVAERAADAQQRAAELASANQDLALQIAHRKEFQEALRQSEALYSSLVEEVPIPILRKDRLGVFIFANRSFCQFVGLRAEEILGKTDLDLFPKELADKYRRDDDSVLNNGELFVDVERNEHHEHESWVHVIKTPVRDADGHIVGTQAIFWDVTARQQFEQALRNSEALYHSLVDNLPVCLLRKDLHGKITFVNQEFCRFFSISREEIIGKTDFDYFPQELAEQYREGDEKVATTGKVMQQVEDIELPTGARRLIDVMKSPVHDAAQEVVGVQIIFRDVTAEVKTERALKKSEQRLQSLLDNTTAVVYVKNKDGKYELVNRRFESLFGVTRKQIVNHTDHDLFPQEMADVFRSNDLRVLESGQVVQEEELAPHEDGPHTYLSVKFPLRNIEGDIAYVAGISTDITDRKRAEEALRESQRRLNLALESAEIGTWHWDVDASEMTWDDRMYHIFGVPRGSFAGNYSAFEECLYLEDRARVNEASQRCLETTDDFDIDYRVVWPDGSIRHVAARAAVLIGADGRPVRMTGVCLDITERKEAEEKLQNYAKKLEVINRELQEFAYVASHDLQEPLRTLSFFSDSLRTSLCDKLTDEHRRDLQFITAASERMQRLVQDLLALSRTGRAAMKREKIQLDECVEAALGALSSRIEQCQAEISVQPLPEVVGDRTLLTQLFQNLIGNALKFTRNESPQVRITAERKDGGWVIGVQDNGIGIKPEYAKKIFAPFKRLHGQSEYEGTGIGLAICRKVVERHGGDIWVDGRPGEGSHFQFKIPAEIEANSTTEN